MTDRVTVTRHALGICHMQVCAVLDATDEEILDVANRDNPSGTQHGWTTVVRVADDSAAGPGPCESFTDRQHVLVRC